MCASFVRTSPCHASSSGGRDQFPGGSVRSFCSPALPTTTIGVPSRRIDPIRYLTRDGDSSRKYVTASVSSGHQIGSKIGPPKPSASAGAAPQSFESISTAETLIESGSPVLRGAFELLMPSSLGRTALRPQVCSSRVIPERWPMPARGPPTARCGTLGTIRPWTRHRFSPRWMRLCRLRQSLV